jgi:hypothetical protein
VNALEFRAAAVLAMGDSTPFDDAWSRRRAELIGSACAELAREYPARECASLSAVERSAAYSRIANRVVREHPLAYAMLMIRGVGRILFGNGAAFFQPFRPAAWQRARVAGFFVTVPLVILACAGLLFWWRVDRTASLVVAAFIAYFVLISAGAEADGRFRVPIMPMYGFLVGGGVAMVAARLWRGQRRAPRSTV